MRWLWLLALGCAPPVHQVSLYPSCDDIVEHIYTLDNEGYDGIDNRREFTKQKPQLVKDCEDAHMSRRQRRCLASARTAADADNCHF
jgi:hypothetical protein